jgi:wobble nucleotide-excising tRNase
VASDEFSGILDEKQQKAKELLRLREVYDFANTIKYSEKVAEIQKLTVNVEAAEKEKKELTDKLQNKKSLLASKKRELNDEEEGAKQVTKYLNDFFGHKFLSLKSVEEELEQEKKVRFEIIRDGKKAYHLSEGECNLISFCYFLAKLKDIETDGKYMD